MTLAITLLVALFVVAPGEASPLTTGPTLTIPAAARGDAGFDEERATLAWLATIPPAASERSDAYFEGGYWITLWRALVSVLAALALLVSGASGRLRTFAERRTRRRWAQGALYGLGLVVALGVLELPWTLYEGFFRERAYGLLNQGLGAWLGDQAKGLSVSAVFGAVFIAAIYVIIARARRTAWAWGAAVAVVLMIVAVAVAPVYIAPLFNDYRALAASPLRDDLLSLARANGVAAGDVFVYDGSRQTNRVTANVSGFGSTLRISASDTLFGRSPPETVRAVFAHELGHYVLGHVLVLVLELGVLLVVGFGLVALAFSRLQRRYGTRLGIRHAADPAGAPLLYALFTAFMLLASPVTNTIVRRGEVEADLFGLNAAREPDGFAFAATQLAEYRKMSPGPLEELLFYDHPSGRTRIAMAMRWKAEQLRGVAPSAQR